MTRAAYPARRVGAGDSRAGYAPAIVPEFLRGDAQPACTPITADFFFAKGQGSGAADYVKARKLCAVCPLVAECGQWAEQNGERWGVWGGINRGRKAGNRPLGRPPKKRVDVTCSDCGLLKTHDGKGRCAACNKRRRKEAA